MDYKFYIQRVDRDGVLIDQNPVDIENSLAFKGLRYRSCEGLETVGAPKNIYTEEYAEDPVPVVFHPSDAGLPVVHKTTTVKLDLVFVGDETGFHRHSLQAFRKFVGESRFYYWDTARCRKVFLMLNSETTVAEDAIKGTRFIEVNFSFTNLWGEGKMCDEFGNVICG